MAYAAFLSVLDGAASVADYLVRTIRRTPPPAPHAAIMIPQGSALASLLRLSATNWEYLWLAVCICACTRVVVLLVAAPYRDHVVGLARIR